MKRSALVIVFLVVVIDLLGFGIVLPLLPLFGREYVGALLPDSVVVGPDGRESLTGTGGAIIGGLMAVFSLMQFVFAPLWGRISDHVGRRPILLLGLGGSVLFYALFGYASALPGSEALLAIVLLFVARGGAGICGATISTAQAVIADCTPPEERKSGMAIIGAAFGVGFTFGPLFGAGAMYLQPDNRAIIGIAASVLSLVSLVLGLIMLPETRDFQAAPPHERRWLNLAAFREAVGNPALGPVMLIFFLATLGFASFEVTLAQLNKDVLGLEEKNNFFVFAYVGFVLVIAQGLIYRRMAKHVSEATFMTLGILLMGLGVLSLGGITYSAVAMGGISFGWLLGLQLAALTLSVVGFAFLTPSAQALISRRADPARQGEILGVNQSISAMARILGPVMGLSLYFATINHVLPFVVGAGLLLAMLPLMPMVRRGEPAEVLETPSQPAEDGIKATP